ncbi:carbohydrate esterase family 9 protein [Mycena floridula]|nr:carbohydrate esterase family 9 protein [Mycena floridula]
MEKSSPIQNTSKKIPTSIVLCLLSAAVVGYQCLSLFGSIPEQPLHAATALARCRNIHLPAGPPKDFYSRKESDRFVPGTRPTLIKNGKIWTGSDSGAEVVRADILIDKGIIMGVGHFGRAILDEYAGNLVEVDAEDSWISPGIVDTHSHMGDGPSPELLGAVDYNSDVNIGPFLRSIDGLNTHDDSYELSIAGGVTTALVLPGSGNAIGGQAYVIKLRKTPERSTSSMVLEAPYQVNTSFPDLPPRWRHMKHACGENPSIWHSNTRMDTTWEFRKAYNRALQIKNKQDEYCAKAVAGKWEGLGEYPEDLEWEALVDVLRGRVKLQVHCYEAVDLDDLVRLTNEFKFPVAAVHHASEAYLVPEVLKKAYGATPAVALFATNSRYKREAYRSSEFAPRILAENGLTVLMKSDHPVLDSRYLLYEAQQAYYYGLSSSLALSSVTTNTAANIGMAHRVGYIKKGWDADLVIWDSHPLALGATPKQVFIDGIAQLSSPHVAQKPESFQTSPKVPNFDKEAKEVLEYDGLPPLDPKKAPSDTVVFTNVKSVYTRSSVKVLKAFEATTNEEGVVVVRNGHLVCSGFHQDCFTEPLVAPGEPEPVFIDLQGGSISPGLLSFGSALGLNHIDQELSTNDGAVSDKPTPKVLGGGVGIVRAADGLQFTTRDAFHAYRAGVTSAITAPTHSGFLAGLGTWFSTGSLHKLEKGAIVKEVTAVHVSIMHLGSPSISTQIAMLRKLLIGPVEGSAAEWFQKAAEGKIPLVVEAYSADIIATLLILKNEVEQEKRSTIKLTITGATEAHLLAKELGEAGVGVVLSSRPFPYTWEQRRILAGPPLTEHSVISLLMAHNVTVGLSILEQWDARNLRFDIGWAALAADGKISKEEALALGSVNLEILLGGERSSDADLVATFGGDLLEMTSKVTAVISPDRGVFLW